MASLVCPDLEAHVSTSFPVLTAAQGGALLDCLKMGGDLNELHIMYGHVLHWAIVTGKLDAAEQMLAAGANVNARGKHGYISHPCVETPMPRLSYWMLAQRSMCHVIMKTVVAQALRQQTGHGQ